MTGAEYVGRLAGSRAVLALAVVEARRLVAHPLYLVLIGQLVLRAGISFSIPLAPTRDSVAELMEVVLFYFPLISLLPANLVASSARRGHVEQALAATPVGAQARTLALGLASLAPAALSATGVLAYWWVAYRAGPPIDHAVPMAVMVSAPLLLVGATTLGVATAGWLRIPGAAIAVMIGLVAWTAISAQHPTGACWSPWILAYTEAGQAAIGVSHLWHAVYLLGLSGLAMMAALLRNPEGRRALVAPTAVVVTLTALAGWAQLP